MGVKGGGRGPGQREETVPFIPALLPEPRYTAKTKQSSHANSAPALGHPETALNKQGYSLQVNYQHRGVHSGVSDPCVLNGGSKTTKHS